MIWILSIIITKPYASIGILSTTGSECPLYSSYGLAMAKDATAALDLLSGEDALALALSWWLGSYCEQSAT